VGISIRWCGRNSRHPGDQVGMARQTHRPAGHLRFSDPGHVQRNGPEIHQFIAQGIEGTDQTTQAVEQEQR
jgi:hypothetical protein